MSEALYRQYGIHDRRPEGVLLHIRRYIGNALEHLDKFQFADARKHLRYAETLSNALQMELDKPSSIPLTPPGEREE